MVCFDVEWISGLIVCFAYFHVPQVTCRVLRNEYISSSTPSIKHRLRVNLSTSFDASLVVSRQVYGGVIATVADSAIMFTTATKI